MDELQEKMTEAQERHAMVTNLLVERSGAAEGARALLAQDSTYPRKRREVVAELQSAEMDLAWIKRDLQPLGWRIQQLEGEIGAALARQVELEAAAAARAQTENDSADAGEKDPATAGA